MALLCLAAATTACDISPFRIGGNGADDDAGTGNIDGGGTGTPDADPNAPDASTGDEPDACIMMPERCDGEDNDCDGNIDEDFNFQMDPGNCGACGVTCSLPGADGTCVDGDCEYTCDAGFHDLNGDLGMNGSNGCEYGPCIGSSSDPEVCDGQDNDCNGMYDDNVPGLDDDIMNCGECFKPCYAVNVTQVTCSSGMCGYTTCLDDKDGVGGGPDGIPDYADVNPNIAGCEYRCPVNPPRAAGDELCNGLDDDCDGVTDELPIAGLGDDCATAPEGDTGECSFGTMQCVFSQPTCVGYQGPRTETCNGKDDDCDGTDDNGFDKDNDPDNCGPSCTVCNLDHAVEKCTAGVCGIQSCEPGYVDFDTNPSNGCEYQCTKTQNDETICDGVDNDCDRQVDENLAKPNICNQNGACSGTEAFCGKDPCDAGSITRWRCRYDGQANTETDACGKLLLQEQVCDSFDGDCDSAPDESFPLGDYCESSDDGICKSTGEYICDTGDPSTVTCNYTNPGASALPNELCNNLDDDCDGDVDEEVVDDMVGIDTDGDTNVDYYIDTYEASRPDASGADDGSVETLACSNPDVLPWRTVTWPDAEAACAAAGKRLCTKVEWMRSCQGAAGNEYPYGPTYDPIACNGFDYDVSYASVTVPGQCNAVQNNEEGRLPTAWQYGCLAAPDTCTSADGIYDLSGNLQEWTGTQVGASQYRQVMGGSYASTSGALACDDDFLVFDNTIAIPTLGFRCCKDGP